MKNIATIIVIMSNLIELMSDTNRSEKTKHIVVNFWLHERKDTSSKLLIPEKLGVVLVSVPSEKRHFSGVSGDIGDKENPLVKP